MVDFFVKKFFFANILTLSGHHQDNAEHNVLNLIEIKKILK